jgi:hypothetical protein
MLAAAPVTGELAAVLAWHAAAQLNLSELFIAYESVLTQQWLNHF